MNLWKYEVYLISQFLDYSNFNYLFASIVNLFFFCVYNYIYLIYLYYTPLNCFLIVFAAFVVFIVALYSRNIVFSLRKSFKIIYISTNNPSV